MVRENFTAGLQAYANGVATENPDGFKAEIEKSHQAGMPIITHDNDMLKDAYAKMVAEQVEAELKAKENAETERHPTETEPPAKPKAKARKAPKAPKDTHATHREQTRTTNQTAIMPNPPTNPTKNPH